MAPKIVLLGYYGSKNTGDEAMLDSLGNAITKLYPNAQIFVFSTNPAYTECLHGLKAVQRVYKFPDFFTCFLKRFAIIRKCDLVIIGGGGLYNDIWHILPFAWFEILLAKIFNKPVYVCGVDVGPYQRRLSKALAKLFLKAVDAVTIRSKGSLEEISKIGISAQQSADLTLLRGKGDKNRGKKLLEDNGIPRKRLVGVSLRQLTIDRKKAIDPAAVANVLDKFLDDTKIHIVFIPFQFPDDLSLSERVMDHMSNKENIFVLENELNFREIKDAIANLDFLIGMRLHSLIFATVNIIPFFAVSYHPKVKDFCGMFSNTIPYVEIRDLKTYDIFYEKLVKAYSQQDKIKKSILQSSPGLRKKAEANLRIIKDLI
ncbi:MAG: polysaccharide pyruvyl transferase family protein [Thermoplasmatota archaeon]